MTPGLFDLSGEVALVTGAGKGLGRAAALALADAGADLALVSRTKADLESLASELRNIGRRALCIPIDLTEKDSAERIVEAVRAEFGTLGILVNNAGRVLPQPDLAITSEAFDELMALNLKAPMALGGAASRLMIERGRGKIINISSLAGITALGGGSGLYGASKAALYSITRAWAVELGRAGHDIQVNCITPGAFRTGIRPEGMTEEQYDASVAANIKMVSARIPLGRLALPEEIGGIIVFLASKASNYITGQNIVIDGGWSVSG